MSIGIVLFRSDLRIADNPALDYACATCDAVIPVYFWDPEALAPWAPGGASRYWQHQSLTALDESLGAHGSRLIIRRGDASTIVPDLVKSTQTQVVCWNRRYAPRAIAADTKLKQALHDMDIEVQSFNGSLLSEPWEIQNKSGEHYRVFTPYWKTCQSDYVISEPLSPPSSIPAPAKWPTSDSIDELGLEPTIDWASGIRDTWSFGEVGGQSILDAFLQTGALAEYTNDRDQMSQNGTSRVSPYLAHGELSPRQIWHAARMADADAAEPFLRQIAWREFAYHMLYHEPHTTDVPLRGEFERFPWRDDPEALKRWQRGMTGYPIVDAGMRELWHTGYMHNRARMVAASFLVKHLMIPWQAGAKWFWDTLVDADLANNTFGWQWTAGCGADAAPYFRIFNPIRQGQRFDPQGAYVRRWVPELKGVADKYVHCPWEAGIDIDYPEPIVDHAAARDGALEAYASIRR